MKWKIKDNEPKHSISSNNSMSFLTDETLTFHRFSDGSISILDRKPSDLSTNREITNSKLNKKRNSKNEQSQPPNISNSSNIISSSSSTGRINNNNNNTINSVKRNDSFTPAIWTTGDPKLQSTSGDTISTQNEKGVAQNNNSTARLMPDEQNKQTKCSIFRGVLFCLCLNLTYANVVRFPRELERHGSAFLVPYFILLVFIGLPIVLLEMALGQFLGQGAANTWRASPFFRGASIVGRVASWICAIWVSLQAVIAVLYVAFLIIKDVPFEILDDHCAKAVINVINEPYFKYPIDGQECLQITFLKPLWKNSGTFYIGILALALILVWVIAMFSAHSGKVLRRAIFLFGFLGLSCLLFVTIWAVTKSISNNYFPNMWKFRDTIFSDSAVWFNALVQVIFSTNIGIGALPVLTGKFLYKGDAVKTSFVYLCFNVLINAIAVTFYLTQFYNEVSPRADLYPELKTLTVLYDHSLSYRGDVVQSRIIPGIAFVMIVLSAIITVAVNIYTSSKLICRHPTYTMCLVGLILSIATIIYPYYGIVRISDTRISGTLIICALIFDIISIAWVYGAKNLYNDLEFSIGRPIFKIWLFFWIITPILLTGILIWWAISAAPFDLLIKYVPRWAAIIFSLGIIVILSCIEISKEVDYNFMSMIKASTKPSTNWGPADPLVRHAWKQWRIVCNDTGQRDFTLRRRGTRDYTNSIKRNQYPHSRYGTHRNNNSTHGTNTPNYSGSIFGDSAIEEDISVNKYRNYQTNLQLHNGGTTHSNSPNISRQSSSSNRNEFTVLHKNKSQYYIRGGDETINRGNGSTVAPNTSRIEITPQDVPGYSVTLMNKNPLAHVDLNPNYRPNYVDNYGSFHDRNYVGDNPDHLCWRKYSGNSEEYSTEL